jgi:hypothetical protein
MKSDYSVYLKKVLRKKGKKVLRKKGMSTEKERKEKRRDEEDKDVGVE